MGTCSALGTYGPSSEGTDQIDFGLPHFMYGHTYRKSTDQPGKVAKPARGQLNREDKYFPVHVRA